MTHRTKKPSLGGSLELEDFGSFFVNGEAKQTLYSRIPVSAAPEEITVKQLYVQYMIPKGATRLPVIMVHGGTHTGKTFETTPDGREGWATYFARKGYPVYNVDMPGRGRAGWDRSSVNQAVLTKDTSHLPQNGVGFNSNHSAWKAFRVGPEFGQVFPGSKFPIEAFAQYTNQLNPRGEVFLGPDADNEIPTQALVALLEEIGPAILMVHSQSGDWGLAATVRKPDLVRAFIAVEPATTNGFVVNDPAYPKALFTIPMLVMFADFVPEVPVWAERMRDCTRLVDIVAKAGGPAKRLHLPEAGYTGNSHMVMMDRNNLEIADLILGWLREAAP